MPKRDDKLASRISRIKQASEADRLQAKALRKSKPRSAGRAPAYKFGILINPLDRSEIRCVITNLSRSGAKVMLEGAVTLAPFVTLKIGAVGAVHRAKVAWQDGNEVGLMFAK